MANTINYAEKFEADLEQKFNRELTSSDLDTNSARFVNAKTVKIPRMTLQGFGDHGRNGGWNRRDLTNDYETKTLSHDRDVEFFIDTEDVDETNRATSAANITNTFATEEEIPELDKYRYSKIYDEWVTRLGNAPDTTVLDVNNVLTIFDALMEKMDEAEVPMEGRIMYATPTVNSLLKSAAQIQREFMVQNATGAVNRKVRSLDEVKIVVVPSIRMKSAYDFTIGAEPAVGAKQINMMIVHPRAVIAPVKRSVIYLHAPGEHTQGDGWLYQNRKYTDLFLIDRKADAVQINAEA